MNELKRELKTIEHKELIQIITELYKVNKDAKLYLTNKFKGEEAIFDLYKITKQKVKDEFFPDRGLGKLRLSEAKNAISNFKKLTSDKQKTTDLMLYYVELGTEFMNVYGDIDAKFYYSMASMYSKVVTECNKNEKLYETFKERLYLIVLATEGIGWGFHEDIYEIYYSLAWLGEDEE